MSATADQRVAVVTGASSGIGKAAARALAGMGWRIIAVGRNPERSMAAEAEIRQAASHGAEVDMLQGDLALVADAERIAGEVAARTDRIDALLNNAGGIVAEHRITPEGHEATFAGNHLGPFVLTNKLMPLLEATARRQGPGKVRIVTVSSTGHARCPAMNWSDLGFSQSYNSGAAYCQAKLANLLFTRELARRAAGSGIVAHAMHPGVVASNFGSESPEMSQYMKSQAHRASSPDMAADTLVWLASAEEPGRSTGGYWHQREEVAAAEQARNDEAASRLWQISETLAGFR